MASLTRASGGCARTHHCCRDWRRSGPSFVYIQLFANRVHFYGPDVTTQVTAGRRTLDDGGSCLLVTGAPGAGKSTVTRLVAQALNRSALIDAHSVGRMVVGGYVWPLGEPANEAAAQVRLVNANVCALAANFADAGFTPVIDWVVPNAQQLKSYRDALASRRLLLVVLDPGSAVCRERNEHRPPQEQHFFDDYEGLRSSMHSFRDLGWWLDTSTLTVEQTVQQILDDSIAQVALTG